MANCTYAMGAPWDFPRMGMHRRLVSRPPDLPMDVLIHSRPVFVSLVHMHPYILPDTITPYNTYEEVGGEMPQGLCMLP
jgi:hypothetical protein